MNSEMVSNHNELLEESNELTTPQMSRKIRRSSHPLEQELRGTSINVVPSDVNTHFSYHNMSKSTEQLLSERNVAHPTSNTDTLMHILKGNIGTGILAMPDALMNSGLTVGTIGLAFIAMLCIHCMHILVKCAHCLCIRTNTPSLDFAATSEAAFSTGPQKFRKYSKIVRFLTNFFLCLTMLGFCCVYIVFVATNVKQVIDEETGYQLNYVIYATILLLPLILINLLRNLKYLVPASVLANILEVVSLVILFYYLFQDLPPAASRKQFASFATLPLWFGTVIFAFEGIGLVLPLENNMKTPQDFGGLNGVLNTGMIIVSCLYVAVGFYGYLKYGDAVLGSITLNLPHEIPAYIVRIAYAVAIFLSYAIQFYVPIQIMFPSIKRHINPRYHYVTEIAFRIGFIILTYALAVLIPQLNLFISLVGSFSGSYLSLILPPVLEVVTFWNEGITWYTIVKDAIIFIIGVLGFITGSYVSISEIVKSFGGAQMT